jgi:hypothetical protein
MAAKYPMTRGSAGRNRPAKGRPASTRPSGGSSAVSFDREAFRQRLAGLIGTVRNAMYVVTVCSDALRSEASDNGREVATILRVYAGDKLFGSVREAAVLLALFDGKTDVDPEGDEIGRMTDPE